MRRFFPLALALLVALPVAADDAAKVVDVSFAAACDGTEQRYVLIEPTAPGVDVLIALHGHGSDRWQFATSDRDEARAARDFARARGMLFVSPDYRAKTSWMGPKAEADLVQIIAELKAARGVRRVFLCGGSMGGTSALTFAALHPDLIDGVAAMNGTANHLEYENFQDAIAESFGGPKSSIPDEYKKRSAEYHPERFTMPVGLTTGGRDELVPPHSVLRLADVLGKIGRPPLLIHREEGGHDTNHADATAILAYVVDRADSRGAQAPGR
ncbi:alpha/beta fold hydrolase [Paludisphaera sp.]|uniref:alpha/beta hydrolase family protein n=1 Tax=Paludisphaera sp. TaxID=2017432 RepID=UPI00301CC251